MHYLLTFTCYGQHLHGHESGSVDLGHHLYGGDFIETSLRYELLDSKLMRDKPYTLGPDEREIVLASIVNVCACCKWDLLAAHVRSTHVHVIVGSELAPELVMNRLKAYASRALNDRDAVERGRKRWTRHGSTRWLFDDEAIGAAFRYVVEEQGEPMAVYRQDRVG